MKVRKSGVMLMNELASSLTNSACCDVCSASRFPSGTAVMKISRFPCHSSFVRHTMYTSV